MQLQSFKESLEIVQSLVTISALLIGGFWAYFRFIRQREAQPKIIFDVDAKVVGKIKNKWIIELSASLENKGLVRHKIDTSTFTFDLRYLSEEDEIKNELIPNTGNSTFQVNFKNELTLRTDNGKNHWLADEWKYTYIEPGTVQKYSHVIEIDEKIKFLLIHSLFKYADKSYNFHSAEKVVQVG